MRPSALHLSCIGGNATTRLFVWPLTDAPWGSVNSPWCQGLAFIDSVAVGSPPNRQLLLEAVDERMFRRARRKIMRACGIVRK
jgi:hypothetical protein